MTNLLTAKGGVIRDREIFLHDGQHLRRVRLSVGVQAVVVALLVALIGWSGFATARMMSAPTFSAASGDMAALAAATELRARQIEQRQELLAAMLAGEELPGALPATTKISSLPAALAGPLARADDAILDQAAATARELDARYARTASALRKLGINPARLAVGGPFESASGGDATFKQLFTSWKKLSSCLASPTRSWFWSGPSIVTARKLACPANSVAEPRRRLRSSGSSDGAPASMSNSAWRAALPSLRVSSISWGAASLSVAAPSRSRTPGPMPSSRRKITPAASRALRTAASASDGLDRPPASKPEMMSRSTPDA